MSALMITSIFQNDLLTVKRLLTTVVDIDEGDEYGRTALWWATCRNNIECVNALLDANANINKADDYYGQTPLHRASSLYHVQCVRVRCFV
jgi:ankyrin repeat protein